MTNLMSNLKTKLKKLKADYDAYLNGSPAVRSKLAAAHDAHDAHDAARAAHDAASAAYDDAWGAYLEEFVKQENSDD